MTFEEFLIANGNENLVEYLKSVDKIEQIPDAFSIPLIEKLKMYFVVGGMPEAVLSWIEDRDVKAVDRVQINILQAYEADFGKYAPAIDIHKIRYIWQSLPSQLARENKKFKYSLVKEGARAREYENALAWLQNTDLVVKVPRITAPKLPIAAYEDLSAFKIFIGDVGLLRKHARLSSSVFMEENRLFEEFKGALTENFVMQSLKNQFEIKPYYWSEGRFEVDFIIQKENDIYPIGTKTGKNKTSISFKNYIRNYEEKTKFGVRFSLKNLSYDGNILNIPLYMIDELERIIDIVNT